MHSRTITDREGDVLVVESFPGDTMFLESVELGALQQRVVLAIDAEGVQALYEECARFLGKDLRATVSHGEDK